MTVTTSTGPGKLLHQARTDLKLPIEDAARLLHLSVRHIQALEDDNYESLSGPTYVRGYLRNYAQLLGLSPDKILASYNKLPIATHAVDLTKLAPPAQFSSNDRIIQLGTVLIFGLIVGLAILWWQGRDETGAKPIPVSEAISSSPGDIVTTHAPDIAAPNQMASADINPVGESATSGDPFSQVDASGQTGSQASIGQPPAATAPGMSESNAVPIPQPAAPPRKALIGPPALGERFPGVRSRVVISAQEDSWADIRDAQQNKLLYETILAGRVVTLEGVAPFSVFLGNVDGVRIEFNGKPYDPSRHKRGQVARFTLDEVAPPGN